MERLANFYQRLLKAVEPAITVMEQAGANDEIPQKLQNEIAELAQKLTNTMQKVRDAHTKHSL
jgi:hypothetical protein